MKPGTNKIQLRVQMRMDRTHRKNKLSLAELNGEGMPEISRFLGIVILMHFRDHNPPHFHVQYNDSAAAVLIETLGLMEGRLPPRVLSLVVEWADMHQAELLENWNTLRLNGGFHRIEPLV